MRLMVLFLLALVTACGGEIGSASAGAVLSKGENATAMARGLRA